jgi:anti-sigma factor RsiW
VDALGPSAPTPAARRHAHAQSMPPLAQRSLLRVHPLVQSALAASGCAVSFMIADRLRRGEIVRLSPKPPTPARAVQRMNNGADRVVLLFF